MTRPLDETRVEAVRTGFAKQGLMHTLGAQLGEIGAGRCEIDLPFAPGVAQQHGFFHGGVVAALADNAAGFAAYTLMEEGRQPLTIEFKINFLAPAKGERLIAVSTILAPGRRIFHASSEVSAIRDGETAPAAAALVTVKSVATVSEI
ncbi:MAG: PaaI family thioesterase [Pseudomonadota bacterium]